MTLTGDVLEKLAAAPEEALPRVLAALDEPDTLPPTWTLADIQAKFGISRPTIWRRLKCAGLEPVCVLGGIKRYNRQGVLTAIAGMKQVG